ncbi:hypothetical protein PV08_04460 [Exophiala spinifera]|uniref:Uncharacterized protein n=1 Tax=Exophiala spinifera TaxID=91928 RepID=A0A0D2C0R2_9EURO|nr:uncharacterized protein PV08_04460 [Exophiala spinifera]KIW17269.1 hypothetical protein PV08_04460 [Exophiala spinifera]
MFLSLTKRLYRLPSSPFSTIITFVLLLCIYVFVSTTRSLLTSNGYLSSLRCCSEFTTRSTVLHSTLIDAGHPHMQFVGRWTSSADGRRRDAAFPGSSVEIILTNTRSISLSLNNAVSSSQPPVGDGVHENLDHSNLRPITSDHKASEPVNLVVQLNNTYTTFTNARAIVPVASDLDPRTRYSLKVRHMGGPNATEGVLEFHGIWVENVTHDTKIQSHRTKDVSSRQRTGAAQTVQPAKKKPAIEILTSETEGFSISKEESLEDTILTRISTWYEQLGSAHGIDTITMSTKALGLLPSSHTRTTTISHLFFRSGPAGTHLFGRPWTFATYRPSILILQLGLTDFTTFFSDPTNRDRHARDQFVNDFVNAYVKFLKTIRRTAYPFDPASLPADRRNRIVDPTYLSNSAPSTLPIFLVAPFSASTHFVTKDTRLERIINDALSRVAQAVRADGDISTFWIDTTGWLDPKRDFDTHGIKNQLNQLNQNDAHDVDGESQMDHQNETHLPTLSHAAHLKVSTLLWDHVCPYIISDNDATTTTANGKTECPFDRRSTYMGNVYLPQDVEVERTVLERKINRIKQQFKITGPKMLLR